MKISLRIIALLALSTGAFSGFEGTYGHVFEIAEEDLLDVMERRLRHLHHKGSVKQLQKEFSQKTLEKLKRPQPVSGLLKTPEERTWTFDPSITLAKNLSDHKGRRFYKAGDKVNPLSLRSLSKTLLFLDGDDPDQVAWAQGQEKGHKRVLWILVKGSPFLLFQENRSVFFDQMGVLVKKLGISHVPASVIQEGKHLRITEHVLDGEGQ
jgi:conjugal transfer pilus assembly protein TraW